MTYQLRHSVSWVSRDTGRGSIHIDMKYTGPEAIYRDGVASLTYNPRSYIGPTDFLRALPCVFFPPSIVFWVKLTEQKLKKRVFPRLFAQADQEIDRRIAVQKAAENPTMTVNVQKSPAEDAEISFNPDGSVSIKGVTDPEKISAIMSSIKNSR